MKKFFYTLIIVSIAFNYTFSQIVIEHNDMPNVGDTIRFSETLSVSGTDYTLTGENYTWDFSDLNYVIQKVDTFVNVSSTPLSYQFIFNNPLYPKLKATIALHKRDIDSIPSIQLSNVYNFYKENNTSYSEIGFAFTTNGIPFPIGYDNADVIYHFPESMGDVDSSTSNYSIDIPSLFYFSSIKKRVDTVDGWGTLTTPYGTFQTIRIKSNISQHDSTYIDSLGTGFPTNINKIEYKWLGKNFGEPLLTITKIGLLPATATYIDSLRYPYAVQNIDKQKPSFNVYPNPCSNFITANYKLSKTADVELSLYSILGNKINTYINTKQNQGTHILKLNIKDNNLLPGIYIMKLKIDKIPFVRRVIIE